MRTAAAAAVAVAATISFLLFLLFLDGSVYFTSVVKNKENINMTRRRRRRRPFVVLHTLFSLFLSLQGSVLRSRREKEKRREEERVLDIVVAVFFLFFLFLPLVLPQRNESVDAAEGIFFFLSFFRSFVLHLLLVRNEEEEEEEQEEKEKSPASLSLWCLSDARTSARILERLHIHLIEGVSDGHTFVDSLSSFSISISLSLCLSTYIHSFIHIYIYIYLANTHTSTNGFEAYICFGLFRFLVLLLWPIDRSAWIRWIDQCMCVCVCVCVDWFFALESFSKNNDRMHRMTCFDWHADFDRQSHLTNTLEQWLIRMKEYCTISLKYTHKLNITDEQLRIDFLFSFRFHSSRQLTKENEKKACWNKIKAVDCQMNILFLFLFFLLFLFFSFVCLFDD